MLLKIKCVDFYIIKLDGVKMLKILVCGLLSLLTQYALAMKFNAFDLSTPLAQRNIAYTPYVFLGEFNRDTDNMPAMLDIPAGSKYEGERLNNLPHGNGMLEYSNGDTYKGEWLNGKRHGIGIFFRCADATLYTGDWIDDKPNGKGLIQYQNGEVYEGEINCNPNGKGIKRYADGSMYSGNWANGKHHGVGIFINEKLKVRLECNWSNGTPDDQAAIVTYPNGDIFTGVIVNDQPNGPGEKKYVNGNKYTGMFRNGAPDGKGTMKYKNGDVYEGVWLNSKDGQGTITFASGGVLTCKWQNGKPIGSGVMIYENGDIYEGALLNGVPHGYGTMEYADGRRCAGNWIKGKLMTESEYD